MRRPKKAVVDEVHAEAVTMVNTVMAERDLWRRADQELVASRGREVKEVVVQLEWIEVARTAGAHRMLGFGTFYEYLRSRLGLGKKATHDRMRIARALAELPGTKAAMAAGKLTLCGARELTRVVTPENEAEWLSRCAGQ